MSAGPQLPAATPRARSRSVTVGLVTALTLTLGTGGCGLLLGDDEPPPGGGSSSSPTWRNRGLSDSEVTATLPAMPAGWKKGVVAPGTEGRRTDPPECIDVLRAGEPAEKLEQDRTGIDAVAYYTGRGDDRRDVTVTVRSHSRPVGSELLDRAGAALSTCEAFALYASGPVDLTTDMRVLVEGLGFPNLGEQTQAIRMTVHGEISGRWREVYFDSAVARQGNDLVQASMTSLQEEPATDELEALLEETLDNLAQTQ